MLPLTYHLRNLQVRPMRTFAALSCVALSVGVFCYLMCFARGLRQAFVRTGEPHNIIVLADGATAESNSAITREAHRALVSLPHLALGDDGRPCISPEVVVQTDIERDSQGGGRGAVPVRGVVPLEAGRVHRQVRLSEGRWFREGSDELIAGVTAAARFEAIDVGSKIECGQRTFTIVGLFRAEGGAREGELWGYLSNVSAAYRRSRYSSVALRLESSEAGVVDAVKRRIADQSATLRGIRETDYYAAQSSGAAAIEGLAVALVVIMGIGVVFAATNTMHASVSGRSREFAMMRAVGFSPRRIFTGILAESLALSIVGGLLGCAACAIVLMMGGSTREFGAAATFTSVTFNVGMTGNEFFYSLAVAGAIGLLGGLWPAFATARADAVTGLRAA